MSEKNKPENTILGLVSRNCSRIWAAFLEQSFENMCSWCIDGSGPDQSPWEGKHLGPCGATFNILMLSLIPCETNNEKDKECWEGCCWDSLQWGLRKISLSTSKLDLDKVIFLQLDLWYSSIYLCILWCFEDSSYLMWL